MIKYGAADYGLLVWYGNYYDYEERIMMVKELGFDGLERLYTTSAEETLTRAAFLKKNGIRTHILEKLSEDNTEILDAIRQGHIAYVINTRDVSSNNQNSDGAQIRRAATENNVTIFTALDTVRVLLDVLEEITLTISTIDA